jgi:hypothetical protein
VTARARATATHDLLGIQPVAAGVLAGAAHRAVHIDWFGEISLSRVDHVRPIDQGPAQSLAGFVPLIN